MPPKRKRGKEEKHQEPTTSKKSKKEDVVLDDESDIEEEVAVEEEEKKEKTEIPELKNFKYNNLETAFISRQRFKGWDSEAYEGTGQKEKWKYHLSKKTAFGDGTTVRVSGSSLLVPPLDPEWPDLALPKSMPFKQFVQRLAANKTVLDIMRLETNIESSAVTDTSRPKGPNFHRGRLQWTSWSTMLQIERTYPGVMEGCQGFGQCLEVLWAKELEKPAITKMNPDEYLLWLEHTLTALNTIVHAQWTDVGHIHPKTVRTFVSVRIIDTLKRSTSFQQGLTKKQQDDRMVNIHKQRWLVVPEGVIGREFTTSKRRLTKFLTKPQQIHERDILEGVKRLFIAIWPDHDTSKKISFGSPAVLNLPDRVRAAVCLLELMCGSRLIGVMWINFFEQLTTGTVAEWKEREPVSMDTYGSVDTAVVVNRLSKEGTKAARARKTETKESEIYDRSIVKPLIEAFVDPQLLFGKQKPRVPVIDVFLRLATAVRDYMQSIDIPGAVWEKRRGIWGLTDEVAEEIPTPLRKAMNNINNGIVKFARRTFTFFKSNQGTHLFRKIYMNWAYNSYASESMKETGFAAAVLGHRGFQVSLNYTSLIIVPSIPTKKLNDVAAFQQRIAALEMRMAGLEKRNPGVLTDHAAFVNTKGALVDVEHLPRAAHKTSVEAHVERAKEIIKRLKEKDVELTWVNMRKMKVNNTPLVRARVGEIERALASKKNMEAENKEEEA